MTHQRRVLSASTLINDKVKNNMNEDLGTIEEIMLDLQDGKIAYAVLSFGGILGMGDKLFAIPWQLLQIDQKNQCLILNIPKERFENMPGFDKNNWPDMADSTWQNQISSYYK